MEKNKLDREYRNTHKINEYARVAANRERAVTSDVVSDMEQRPRPKEMRTSALS